MAISHFRSKRKVSGGRYKKARSKRERELGRYPSLTKITKRKLKSFRVMGGNKKMRLLAVDVINLFNPKTKKFEQAKIKSVLENPANRHFVRRNIMTKGTVVDTEKGKVKITSRPGQDGSLNGVLLE